MKTDRACVACDRVYSGELLCPDCGEPGEPIPVRVGRPRLKQRRNKRFEIQLLPEEIEALREAAEAAGRPLARWARERLLESLSGSPG